MSVEIASSIEVSIRKVKLLDLDTNCDCHDLEKIKLRLEI